MKPQIISARSAYNPFRVVDMPEWYGGVYELSSGKKGAVNKQYVKSAWAFACMQIRGNELANLPWRLVDASGAVVESHPVKDMLQNFGPESNYHEVMIATEIDLLMTGAAYWLIDGDILQRINPSTITVKKDRSGIQAFEQTIEGKVVNRFAREEIVYFREHNPDDDLGVGVAPMTVIKRAIDTEYESAQFVNAHFKNDAVPALLLTTPQALPQSEIERTLSWWEKRFKGSKNAGKVAVVGQDLKAQLLAADMEKNAVVAIRDQARADICVGLRVPRLLVGAMEANAWSVVRDARRFLIEDVIIPRSVYFADVINSDFGHRMDPNVTLEFAAGDLPILQEDATAKWQRLDAAVQRGAISLEFARSEMGWPETAAPTAELPPEQVALRQWRTKATNAFRKGLPANVEFETADISINDQLAIRAKLAESKTLEAIEEAFK